MDRRGFLYKGTGLLLLSGVSMIGLYAQTDKNKKFTVISQRCDGCGHCFRACRDNAIFQDNRKAIIDTNKCKGCGDCTRFCRRMAIVEKKA
jgi:MinD superfamily P-loop ATPase